MARYNWEGVCSSRWEVPPAPIPMLPACVHFDGARVCQKAQLTALRAAAAPFACWYQDLADSEKAEHSMVQRISSLGGGKAPTKGDLRRLKEAHDVKR